MAFEIQIQLNRMNVVDAIFNTRSVEYTLIVRLDEPDVVSTRIVSESHARQFLVLGKLAYKDRYQHDRLTLPELMQGELTGECMHGPRPFKTGLHLTHQIDSRFAGNLATPDSVPLKIVRLIPCVHEQPRLVTND